MQKLMTPESMSENKENGGLNSMEFKGESTLLKRPMALFGFPFFLTLILASFLPAFSLGNFRLPAVMAFLCLFGFLSLLLNRKIRNNRQIMTVVFAVVTAFSVYFLKELIFFKPMEKFDSSSGQLTLQTLDYIEYSGNSGVVSVKIISAKSKQDKALEGRKASFWTYGNEFSANPFDYITGDFDYRLPSDSIDGNIRGYSKSRNISLNLSSGDFIASSLSVTPPETLPPEYFIVKLKKNLTEAIMSTPKIEDSAGLMTAIAIGDTSEISSSVRKSFRAAGFSHLLAVSGLQITLISQGVFLFLTFLKFKKKLSAMAAIGCVLLFMGVTGFSGAVVRAGFMGILYLAGILIGRETDGLNSLGFSVTLICVLNPYSVHDAGLLLSFGATLGLIVVSPYFERCVVDKVRNRGDLLRFTAPVLSAFFLTISANVFILPVLVLSFGYISLVAPIANIFVTLPVLGITVLTLIGGGIKLIPPLSFLGDSVLFIAGQITKFVCFVAESFAKIPYAEINVKSGFAVFLVLSGIPFLIIAFKFFGGRGVRLGAILLSVFFIVGLAANSAMRRNAIAVSVLSVGNGSGILISGGGKTGLAAMGEKKTVPKIIKELEKTPLKKLDFIAVDSNSDICGNIGMIAEIYEIKDIITTSGGKYFSSLSDFKISGEIVSDDKERVYLSDFRLDLNFLKPQTEGAAAILLNSDKGGFVIFPESYNAKELAESFDGFIGIFTTAPPLGYKALKLSAGVVNCDKEKLKYVEKAFKEVSYPIKYTSRGETGLKGLFYSETEFLLPKNG